MSETVELREVEDSDLPLFFAHQADPIAHRMADFPARDHDAFMAHWAKIRAADPVWLRTIVVDGTVVGNVLSFEREGVREVGYWLGREFWGRGIATRALAQFLALLPMRPLYAGLVATNLGSRRVLEKCGFTLLREEETSLQFILPPPRHPRAPVDVAACVRALERHDVRFVITGSVAARLHGVALEPRDLDIVPDLEPGNLARLFRVLDEIEATPEGFGHWETEDGGRQRWIVEEAPPERLARWRPDAADLASIDHLYMTRHGDFDVVPVLTGAYGALRRGAVAKEVSGMGVLVAGIDDLLTPLAAAGRPRHLERAARLREIRDRA